ncbi:MAG: hypothetical protein Q8L66_13880 [Caulobacter sp.]|nr:hypothetical protein [Caulobacter sp.]
MKTKNGSASRLANAYYVAGQAVADWLCSEFPSAIHAYGSKTEIVSRKGRRITGQKHAELGTSFQPSISLDRCSRAEAWNCMQKKGFVASSGSIAQLVFRDNGGRVPDRCDYYLQDLELFHRTFSPFSIPFSRQTDDLWEKVFSAGKDILSERENWEAIRYLAAQVEQEGSVNDDEDLLTDTLDRLLPRKRDRTSPINIPPLDLLASYPAQAHWSVSDDPRALP